MAIALTGLEKAGLLVAACAGLGAFLRWFERVNLYHPGRILDELPGSAGLAWEEARFASEDGTRLHGWVIRGRAEPRRGRVLFFHGNAGNISHRLGKAALLAQEGLEVFLFDYRGYGLSGGSPGEKGLYLDGRAARRFLGSRGPEGVAYYGESLGCAVALQTALDFPPEALVLDAAFTSVPDMARVLFPGLPLGWLLRERYDNLAKVPGLRCPLLAVHSRGDELVPFSMGRALFEAAPGPKRFLESRGGHNDGFLETPLWSREIADFIFESRGP
jgi:fermentation-respiration switch protein FrsA (DUF1100 family)